MRAFLKAVLETLDLLGPARKVQALSKRQVRLNLNRWLLFRNRIRGKGYPDFYEEMMDRRATRGARLIEAHVTDCKTGRDFRDHALAFKPPDLAALVKSIARVRASLGSYGKQPQPCDLEALPLTRKGLVAARDLAGGSGAERCRHHVC